MAFLVKISFSKKYARANMKYEIEIRSLKGYRFGVQYIWEKEILVREQLFHHAIESKTHDHFRCKTFYAYGVRQLPDKWSLYKQDFLELVQERIVPASFCRAHLTFPRNFLTVRSFWIAIESTKIIFIGLKSDHGHMVYIIAGTLSTS